MKAVLKIMLLLVMTELFHVGGLLIIFGTPTQTGANTLYLQDTETGNLQRTKRHTMDSLIDELTVNNKTGCSDYLLALQKEHKKDGDEICDYLKQGPLIIMERVLVQPIVPKIMSMVDNCTANNKALFCEVSEEHNTKCCGGGLPIPETIGSCPEMKECRNPSPTDEETSTKKHDEETYDEETYDEETSSANISGPSVMLTIVCMMVIFCLVNWLEQY